MKNPFLFHSYCTLFFITFLFLVTDTSQAQWIQKGNHLSNPQIIRTSFGNAVSISADGQTALIGGYVDFNNTGTSWAYTNTGTSFDATGFSQVGPKMVSSDYSVYAKQGYSVDISADGQIAVVGGPGDNNFLGAAWIYTFNGTVFEHAGNKLVGTGNVGTSEQGTSVSISTDGKTVLVGGQFDNVSGAVWIYTFNGSNFVQFGNKIVGSGYIGFSRQGSSVSISDDSKTLVIGGQGDNGFIGAAWIFTFNGTSFEQAGNKLVGTGVEGASASQGYSVCISGDGKAAFVGGPSDNSDAGATWVYTFNGNNFVQLGDKLVGSNAIGKANQGESVSISSDGKTAVIGGALDNNRTGAAWTYIYNGSSFVEVNKIVGSGISGNQLQGQSVSISGDGKIILVGGSDANVDGAVWVFENPNPTCAPPVIHNVTTFPGICEGTDPVLSLTVTGFPSLLSYQWYQDQISIPGANASSLTLPGVNSTSTGIYTCMISNACGSITSDGINLVVNPVLTVSGNVIPGPVCKGSPVTITGSGSANIFVSNGDTLGVGFIPAASGMYILNDTTYQCTLPAVVTVTVLTLPSLSLSGNSSICPGSSASLSVSGAFFYSWSTGSSTTEIVVMPEAPTTYQVTATGFNGCTVTSSIAVNVTSLVSIPIIGNASVCIGDSVHLSVNHLTIASWSTLDRDTSISFVPVINTLVTLAGITDQGCQGKGFISITVNSLPAVSLDLTGINHLCNTVGSVALSEGLPTGGIYQYKGDTVRMLDISVPGDYAITYYYKNAHGCVNTVSGMFAIILCTVSGPCDLVHPPCTCPGYTCPPHFKIYNAFTPNHDGLNETWVIDSLPADNHIVILDKWGNEAFQADDYDNTWDGKKDHRDLPAGVYYFIVEIEQNTRRFAGTVSIIR